MTWIRSVFARRPHPSPAFAVDAATVTARANAEWARHASTDADEGVTAAHGSVELEPIGDDYETALTVLYDDGMQPGPAAVDVGPGGPR